MCSSSDILAGFAGACVPDANLVSSAPTPKVYWLVREVTIDRAARWFLNPPGNRDQIRAMFFSHEIR
jgi:hypothetical protein